jgi:hypothetical protein
VARYGAIGRPSRHTKVVLPPVEVRDTSTPLAITVSPLGTVTLKV